MLTKEKSSLYFVGIIMLILLFVYNSSSILSADVVVFYLDVNKVVLLIAITLLFVSIYIVKFSFDFVLILLLINAVFGLLPILYTTNLNNYLGNYLPLLLSFFSYFICLQTKDDIADTFYKLFILVSLIISFQVIYTEWIFFSGLSLTNFNNVIVKSNMNIPIGSSNLIASFLLPMIVFIMLYKKSLISYSTILICIYALILCRSKNALIILMCFILFFPMLRILGYVIKDKTVNFTYKIITLGIIGVLSGFLFWGIVSIGNFLLIDLSFNYNSSISNPMLNKLDELSSGRITVYIEQLNRISQNFFWGNGYGYNLGDSKSHNWIIDLMVQRGIIGTIIYLISISIVLKNGLKYKKDKFVRSVTFVFCVIFIQGLFEISLFTIGIDIIVWSMAGFLMARVKYIHDSVDIKQE